MNPNKCSRIFGPNFKTDNELCLKGVTHVPRNVRQCRVCGLIEIDNVKCF